MSLMTRFEHGAIRKGFILEEVVYFSFKCFLCCAPVKLTLTH